MMPRGRTTIPVIALLLFVSSFQPLWLSAKTGPDSDTSQSERLKERVTEFYTALKSKDRKKASEFVISKSKKLFLAKPQENILEFRVSQVEMEESGKAANVEVLLKIVASSPNPILNNVEWPRLSRWTLLKGKWYCDVENEPPSLAAKMEKYAKKPKKPSEVKFDQDTVDFGIVAKGKSVTLKFPFTNLSAQPIKLEKAYLRATFAKDSTRNRTINAQEKGEVIIDLDTSQLQGRIEHSILVEFQPIEQIIQLKFKGRVLPEGEVPPDAATK
jgi:hypothetical protein